MPLTRPDDGVPFLALLRRFALIYLPIVSVFTIILLSGIRLDEQKQAKEIEGKERARIAFASAQIMQDFSAVSTELRVISSLPLLRWYLDSGNPAQREELERLFMVLMRGGQHYDQMRYIDADGQEVIRVNYNAGKPAIVPPEQLQNKAERPYFRDTLKLDQGEAFISPLDLNVEHGIVEIPNKPMIRFGTPVFDSAGRKRGVIVLNYFGRELLQRFHVVMQESGPHRGMLLNRDGYWLSSARREDEWGFMLGNNEHTFGRDFAEEWATISATEQGSLLTDRGLFVFATVYPLLPGHALTPDSPLENAPSPQDLTAHEYQWKIVSFVPRANIAGAAIYNQPIGRVIQSSVYLLLALAAWLIALTTLRRKQAEDALRESEARFSAIIEATPVPFALNDAQGNITFLNPAFVQTLGYTTDDIPSLADWWTLAYPDPKYRQWAAETWQNNLDEAKRSNGDIPSMEVNIRCKDGSVRTFIISATPLQMHFSGMHLVIFYDITERKAAEEKINMLAFYDSLTQLPNRRLLTDRLDKIMAASKRSGRYGAVMFLDLDNFKPLNDEHGHSVGDLLLVEVAQRIVHCVREMDTAARFGGDEFVVILSELDEGKTESASQAGIVGEKIRVALDRPFVLKLQRDEQAEIIVEHHCTASIGITLFIDHEVGVEEILMQADAAMYQAKEAGRNQIRFYEPKT